MKIIRRALCALALGPAFAVYADFSWELSGALGQADSDVQPRTERVMSRVIGRLR